MRIHQTVLPDNLGYLWRGENVGLTVIFLKPGEKSSGVFYTRGVTACLTVIKFCTIARIIAKKVPDPITGTG